MASLPFNYGSITIYVWLHRYCMSHSFDLISWLIYFSCSHVLRLPLSQVTVFPYTQLGRSTQTLVFVDISYVFCVTSFLRCLHALTSRLLSVFAFCAITNTEFLLSAWACDCVIGTWPPIYRHLTPFPPPHLHCRCHCLCRRIFHFYCHLICRSLLLLNLSTSDFEFSSGVQLLLARAFNLSWESAWL